MMIDDDEEEEEVDGDDDEYHSNGEGGIQSEDPPPLPTPSSPPLSRQMPYPKTIEASYGSGIIARPYSSLYYSIVCCLSLDVTV